MSKVKRDEDREERISMEIVVDAYGVGEQAMGWYYYLEEQIQFPSTAVCMEKRAISPLQTGDEVHVIAMASEGECEKNVRNNPMEQGQTGGSALSVKADRQNA